MIKNKSVKYVVDRTKNYAFNKYSKKNENVQLFWQKLCKKLADKHKLDFISVYDFSLLLLRK